ncbi:MAG: OmpA family protein [Pseudoalteromonas sp.]
MNRFYMPVLGLVICSFNSYSASTATTGNINFEQYLQMNAKVIERQHTENFKSPLTDKVTNEKTNIEFYSNYINTQFKKYTKANNSLNEISDLYIKQGYKTLSSCAGLKCGNSLELASRIDSNNFLSEKDKQKHTLLYNNYNWVSLHISAYEEKNFLSIRFINEKNLEPPLQRLSFEKDNYSLSSSTIEKLKSYIPAIKKSPVPYYIIGHTDNTGCQQYYYSLAKLRADAIYRYLVSNGVEKDKLTVESAGEKAPLSTNSTKQGQAENRRVELIAFTTI